MLFRSTVIYKLAFSGAPIITSVSVGTPVTLKSNELEIQFSGGQAVVNVTSNIAQSSVFSLTDSRATGLAAGPNSGASYIYYYRHLTGIGPVWSDDLPLGNTPTLATRACETYYGPGNCATNANQSFRSAALCGFQFLWTHTSFSQSSSCFGLVPMTAGRTTSINEWNPPAFCGGCGGASGTNPQFSCMNCWFWN